MTLKKLSLSVFHKKNPGGMWEDLQGGLKKRLSAILIANGLNNRQLFDL